MPSVLEAETALEEGRKSSLTHGELEAYKEKYTSMVAQDLMRLRPDVIIVLENALGFEGFDFIKFYEMQPDFRAEFAHYERVETLSFDRRIYFRAFRQRWITCHKRIIRFIGVREYRTLKKPPKAENSAASLYVCGVFSALPQAGLRSKF